MPIVSVDQIIAENRLRHVDAKQVEALASSIAEVGLLNPVTVYERGIGFGLIAGAHRLEAVRSLGLAEIEAHIVKLDDDDRIIAECDENLCAAALSPSDRARFTDERKKAYERKHPEATAGAIRAQAANIAMGHDVDANLATTFAADTAVKTGQSERSVQRDAERGEKVIAEVMDMIRGTKLDTGTYLDKIKNLPPNEQVAAAKRDLSVERSKAAAKKAKPKATPEPIDPIVVRDRHVSSLMNAWNAAPQDARDIFLEMIRLPVVEAA